MIKNISNIVNVIIMITVYYDKCAQWEGKDCYKKEGCIWDESLIFGGVTGLCKTGTCENLLNEKDCNSLLNGDLCGYIGGLCKNNPCSTLDCEGNISSGCKLSSKETCVVDECMKYDENICKLDGVSDCVVKNHNGEKWCVKEECSTLDVYSDCIENEDRCKVVKSACVENPCVSDECESPSCKKGKDDCVYDECAQYIPSSLF
jgi:hypothetical protein